MDLDRLFTYLGVLFFSKLTTLRLSSFGKIKRSEINIVSSGGTPILQIHGTIICSHKPIVFVNNANSSTLGINKRCKLLVYKDARLIFNGKVGMSNTVIVATKRVEIGDNVMIGGGVTIVDCDFHSNSYNDWFTEKDEKNMISKPVYIGNNVFIGMHSIILKGVHIGNGSVVGAGSVVTRDIPDNQIWAGNPAKFVKMRC